MLKRYIGNKTDLVPDILAAVEKYTPKGGTVGDLFAGTMWVSLALKNAGYNVVANDINLFSSVLGKAFVVNNHVPLLSVPELVPLKYRKECFGRAEKDIEKLNGQVGFNFLSQQDLRESYRDLLTVLHFLASTKEPSAPSHIFDTYCEAGAHAQFVSARGRTGLRRFFIPENARQIDCILNQVRDWRRNHKLSDSAYYVLCSATVRAVEKVSNTQGTYHDFPRDRYDSRALKPISFEPPPFDATLTGGRHVVGDAEDSLEFANKIPFLDALYLDPPYNFRQYTSYYFFPNMLCRYADIDDLEAYFDSVQFVRGQNMDDDFTSSFCKSGEFISSLAQLMDRAESQVVILSYFNGRNHWNDFKSDCNGRGFAEIERLFAGPLFEPKASEVLPIKRLNYQSYGGYKAKEIDEYLFIGKRNVEVAQRTA